MTTVYYVDSFQHLTVARSGPFGKREHAERFAIGLASSGKCAKAEVVEVEVPEVGENGEVE